MLTGRDVVLISGVDWDPLWQSPQEIATRLVAAGNRVLYVENTGVRAPRLDDLHRVIHRLAAWGRGVGRSSSAGGSLSIVSPLVLPPFGSRLSHSLNRVLVNASVRRRAQRLGMREPIVWTWLPTDTALTIAEALRLPSRTLVYFCTGSFESLTPRVERLRRVERDLVARADLVLVHTQALYDARRPWARRLAIVPPLVDLAAFPRAPVREAPPERPVVGYVGGLHRLVDYDLLAECVRRTPEWTWAFVGPVQTDVSSVAGQPNVEIRGAVAHDALAAQIAGFDVCIVPYARTTATEDVAPTKINEYLAVGRPVVATDLPWVREFQARDPVLEVVPPEPDAFLAAVRRALASSHDRGGAEARRRAAVASNWEAGLEGISRLVDEVLDGRAA